MVVHRHCLVDKAPWVRDVMKENVQIGSESERCLLFNTRLMAQIGTVPADHKFAWLEYEEGCVNVDKSTARRSRI